MVGDGDGVVVLGAELAAARKAERRRVPVGPSPLADVDYPAGSGDLWRWAERSQDGAVAAFVAAYRAADEGDRAAIRASLTMDNLYTVLLFARRRAFAAIRARDPQAVVEAFDALSAIDLERVDWRDVSVAAMLAAHAAPGTGIAAVEASAGALVRADPQVAEVLSAAVEEDEDTDLAESCGLRVVATADGPVLFEDEMDPYEPERDLAPLALALAAAIDSEGTYRVDSVGLGTTIAPIWVDGENDRRVAAAVAELTGCVSIHAQPVPGPERTPGHHFLLVYVAEAATAEDATAIAHGAGRGGHSQSVVLGVPAGRLCAVLVAASVSHGQPSFEHATTITRFRPAISALLS